MDLKTKILLIISFILILIIGGIDAYRAINKETVLTSSVSSLNEGVIIVNNIQRTAKLTIIENNFTEIFTYNSYEYWDISLFRKKMVVKVDARVGMGLDLKQLDIEIDELNKRILVNKIPDAEIMYIEDNIDYYDTEEGMFSAFNETDYTQIHQQTKQKILDTVNKSDLFKEVRVEFINHLMIVADLSKIVGWELVINDTGTENYTASVDTIR
jgi:hypothetical protein